MATPSERRADQRQWISRPGKLLRRATRRFTPAQTVNVSAGGALLEVRGPIPFGIGERVDIAVVESIPGIIHQDAMMPGHVVRISNLDDAGKQYIAVRYDEPGELPVEIITPERRPMPVAA